MQDCRSMGESCQCPRCRYEMRMPSQPASCGNMGGLPQGAQQSCNLRVQAEGCQRAFWQNTPDPVQVFQNFNQGNPQKLPQECPSNWNQNFRSSQNCIYGQQAMRQGPQKACQQCSQQFSQQFSQGSPQQMPQRSVRKCYFRLPLQSCGQQPPPKMFPGAFENNNCFEQNVNNRRCCYCVTHEMGVQTDEFECEVKTDQESSGDDESQRDSSASEVFVTEVITKEAEVTHRTGHKETIIEKYESVAHIPNIEDPERKKQPKEKNQEDNALREEPKKAETPPQLMRISELYPIVESFMAEVPVSGSQSGTEEMIYNQYQTYERHADEPEGKATVEELVEQPKSKADSPISSISKMRTPKPRLSKSRSPISSSPKPPKPVSSPKSGNDSPKEVSESPKPVSSPKSGNDSPKEVSEPPKPVSSPKSGKDLSSPEVSEPNSKENVPVKEKEEKDDNVSEPFVMLSSNPTTEEENEEEMEEEKPTIARSKIPSDVSTVHVRVTNRRVARKKRPNARESPTNVTGIFESRVSQLLLKKKREKPEEKKPKIRAPPKLEVKTGYPPNDLVCRFANPPKCRPACNIIQCPCSGPNFCDPCCSCPPSTRQCDPIYGFGSQCIGYYCH